MTGDKILDAIEHIDTDLIEAADVPPKKNFAKFYWFAAVAAVLAIDIGIGALFGGNILPIINTGPAQLDSFPTTGQPDGPSPSLPSNICFDSVAQIQELFAAAEESQEALDYFLEANIAYYGTNFSTQEDILKFRALLDTVLLPCQDDYENTFNSLYYYPCTGSIDIFYDVKGVRYLFIIGTSAAWNPDGSRVTTVIIDGVSSDLREGSYANSRRLFATFYVGEHVISMWANTTNPDEVDLSGFYWGYLTE